MASRPPNRDQERLELLVRAGEIFHQSLDVDATLHNVAHLAVESFADLCLFDLIDDRSERLFVTAAAHRDPSREQELAFVGSLLYNDEFRVHPVVEVTRTGEPFFLPRIDEETLWQHAASRPHERYMREFGYRSKIVVPVTAQRHIFGALTFVSTDESHYFDASDLLFAIEIGRRAGVAVANAKQFHRERYVAETLQRAFLPSSFPVHDGIEFSAHYRPGSGEADIGGDWYDAFPGMDGQIVITIGDVTGKGVEAARVMILMRQAIRIAALDSTEPRRVAQICNRLLLTEGTERIASAFIGFLEPYSRRLRYVSAGHAPPLLRLPHGEFLRLEAPSPPLGALAGVEFEVHEQTIPEGAMLVLYTDGIIEITHDAIAGERMLESVIASEAFLHTTNPAGFVERSIGHLAPRDDIAVLVVKFGGQELRWQFEASDARAAYGMRGEFFAALQDFCGASDADISICGTIFAELVGNAVRHAPGPLEISLQFRNSDVVLHIIDKGPGFDYAPSLPEDLWLESGRGLFLVSKLASNVQAERLPEGSHIAVTLPCGEVANAAETGRNLGATAVFSA